MADPVNGLLGPNPDAAVDVNAWDAEGAERDDDNDEDEYDNEGIYDSSDDVEGATGPPYYEDSEEEDSDEEWREQIFDSDA